mgnify:FL=1
MVVGGLARIAARAVKNTPRLTDAPISQTTQRSNTTPTYERAASILNEINPKGKTLDYGAGLGIGSKKIKADSFEPFPQKDFEPNFTQSRDIPTESYEKVVNLNVLNVLEKSDRDAAIQEIGRILKPNGSAIITTRGKDVLDAAGKEGPEPMSIITKKGTYQKGFTIPELVNYVQNILGNDFSVTQVRNLGKAAVKIQKKIKKYSGGMIMRSPYSNYKPKAI